ncbi:hypothetical protein FB451DRAFT_1552850 [Mycena latifolia]|nr:hypothetical protein FB451DRAFT_1552850 [Mycena latifolia]
MASIGNPMAVQELVDYCIDFLFASAPDLKACALVSRSWTAAAQMHLFSCIVVGSPGYSYGQTTLPDLNRRRCHRLFEVLATSPRLIGWIESLEVHLDTLPHDILRAISMFPFVGLRRILVSGNWAARETILVTQDLFAFGTLTNLSIAGNFRSLSNFVEVLERCSPNIRDVSFGRVHIEPIAPNSLAVPHGLLPLDRRIEIDSLDLWWSSTIHHWLNSPQCRFGFANLKRLRLNENTSLPQWTGFAPSIPGVEHLQFQPQVPGPSIIDLEPFASLKSIEIFLEYKDDVAPALETLSTIVPSNQIQTLRLRLPNPHLPDADVGAEMDRHILALPLSHLRAVELVYGPLGSPPRLPGAEILPLLSARKLVRVYTVD